MTLLVFFVVAAVATARVVRIITDDIIGGPLRAWWKRRAPGRILKLLVTCAWCLSIWFSPITLIAYLVSPGEAWAAYDHVFIVGCAMLISSYYTGISTTVVDFISAKTDTAEADTLLANVKADKLQAELAAQQHNSQD